MRRIFDFKCPTCDCMFEELVEGHPQTIPCIECGDGAERQIATPRLDWKKMGLDPGFPSAYEKWGKAKRKHSKTDRGTMHGGKAPNLLMH